MQKRNPKLMDELQGALNNLAASIEGLRGRIPETELDELARYTALSLDYAHLEAFDLGYNEGFLDASEGGLSQ